MRQPVPQQQANELRDGACFAIGAECDRDRRHSDPLRRVARRLLALEHVNSGHVTCTSRGISAIAVERLWESAVVDALITYDCKCFSGLHGDGADARVAWGDVRRESRPETLFQQCTELFGPFCARTFLFRISQFAARPARTLRCVPSLSFRSSTESEPHAIGA